MSKYQNASDEPLEIIEANECSGHPDLATKRFRRLFNEIYALREQLAAQQSVQRTAEWRCPKCEAMNYGDCWKCGERQPAAANANC